MRNTSDSNIKLLINELEEFIDCPALGLPEEVFLLVSRLTPLINVDLLVKNDKNETLLIWREDEFFGPGWHVPGGIIRFKERISDRIQATALEEFGAKVEHDPTPILVHEYIDKNRNNRGHGISLVYFCRLLSFPDPDIENKEEPPKAGQWRWHSTCPENLIKEQDFLRKYI